MTTTVRSAVARERGNGAGRGIAARAGVAQCKVAIVVVRGEEMDVESGSRGNEVSSDLDAARAASSSSGT